MCPIQQLLCPVQQLATLKRLAKPQVLFSDAIARVVSCSLRNAMKRPSRAHDVLDLFQQRSYATGAGD